MDKESDIIPTTLIPWRKGWDLNPRYGFPYA